MTTPAMKEEMREAFEALIDKEGSQFGVNQYTMFCKGYQAATQYQQAKIDSYQAALSAAPAQELVSKEEILFTNASNGVEIKEESAIVYAYSISDTNKNIFVEAFDRHNISWAKIEAKIKYEKQSNRIQQPAQEPYGYVTTLRNGTKHFYESMPYLDNAVKCDTVYLRAQQPVKQGEIKAKLVANMIRYLGATKTQAKAIVDGVFDGEHTINQADLEPIKQDSWMPIETAPKGKKIIVKYKNAYGNERTVFAKYIERFTEEPTCECECDEYDEKTDTYYLKEGWVELVENWDEFSSVYFDSENAPTGWLPAPPIGAQP